VKKLCHHDTTLDKWIKKNRVEIMST